MSNFDFSTYISPFTWRYGSDEMKNIFSEEHKYRLWRIIWIALAQTEYKAGLLTKKELTDLEKNEKNIDIQRILEIEKETRHDVVAAIKEFAEKAKIGGGKIHLGATSYDIVDNADAIRAKEALAIVESKLITLISQFGQKIKQYADFPCIGYTHLQPAEPTTVGYRLAFYAQDLLIGLDFLRSVKKNLRGKGLKGAVGTAASYQMLLNEKQQTTSQLTTDKFEKEVMKKLEMDSFLITNQIQPKIFDLMILNCLAVIASSLAKFAGDLRLLQSPNIGEWSEPFGKKQVGSSAMPFKKNPITAENICSLARIVANLPRLAWDNSSLSYLERTLDDSANRRIFIPEAFLSLDQMLDSSIKILSGLVINEKRITTNLNLYAPFAVTEAILMAAVKNGANRQEMHEVLREISMIAWQTIQEGRLNPMFKLLTTDERICKFIAKRELEKLFNIKHHIGNAPERARLLVKKIKTIK